MMTGKQPILRRQTLRRKQSGQMRQNLMQSLKRKLPGMAEKSLRGKSLKRKSLTRKRLTRKALTGQQHRHLMQKRNLRRKQPAQTEKRPMTTGKPWRKRQKQTASRLT